jgi:hypothetical protein
MLQPHVANDVKSVNPVARSPMHRGSACAERNRGIRVLLSEMSMRWMDLYWDAAFLCSLGLFGSLAPAGMFCHSTAHAEAFCCVQLWGMFPLWNVKLIHKEFMRS